MPENPGSSISAVLFGLICPPDVGDKIKSEAGRICCNFVAVPTKVQEMWCCGCTPRFIVGLSNSCLVIAFQSRPSV